MSRWCREDLALLEEEAARPSTASSPRDVSRVLALQRSAGNAAVSAALQGRATRPVLQRFDVSSLSDLDTQRLEQLDKTYEAAFGVDGQYYATEAVIEEFDSLVQRANGVDALELMVQARIDRAKAKANRLADEAKAGSAKPSQKPEKTAADSDYGATKAAQGPGAGRRKQKAKKADDRRGQTVTVEAPSTSQPAAWKGQSTSAAIRQAPTPQQPQLRPGPGVNIADFVARLEDWDPFKGHDGSPARTMSVRQADALVDWALGAWKRAGAITVIKGAGSGDWREKAQLKFAHAGKIMPGGKKSTYHFTLTKNTYDKLRFEENDD